MISLAKEVSELEKFRKRLHLIFPSYITHIRFPRYKNMTGGARIDFGFPITALVGSNGSGKTSVLNALYGAPNRKSTSEYWFSTEVDPIVEGEGSPNRFIYGHYNKSFKELVETRKARVKKMRHGREDPNYWEPTKEAPGDDMVVPVIPAGKILEGRSLDRWNPVKRKVLYINFRKELSAFDKYFYFGKNPVEPMTKEADAKEEAKVRVASRRIRTKIDQVRYDSTLLNRVITSGDTSVLYRKRKIATENRLLTKEELGIVSYVLGREYVEARWVKHRLFKGDGGLSILFKTEHGRYSEAFAGSGEVAVTSCVVQILGAAKGTLLLLDEPEVSLHPGAQERLLAFLARMVRQKQIQVVFSTHSPHLISALPDDAIKVFHQLTDGGFSVIPATHPYAAFRRLGATYGNQVLVIVEDRLAQSVVQQALSTIDDEATRQLFRIDYHPGGASSLLASRIPVLMDGPEHVLILLDGDQKKVAEISDPEQIPVADDGTLEDLILAQVGVRPVFAVDGGAGGGNVGQRIAAQRRYLAWVRKHVAYIPTSSPEELVLQAAGVLNNNEAGNSQACKLRLQQLASDNLGLNAGSAETDAFGNVLLGMHRARSRELNELAATLTTYLATVKAAPAA